jgi:hypothetical protein
VTEDDDMRRMERGARTGDLVSMRRLALIRAHLGRGHPPLDVDPSRLRARWKRVYLMTALGEPIEYRESRAHVSTPIWFEYHATPCVNFRWNDGPNTGEIRPFSRIQRMVMFSPFGTVHAPAHLAEFRNESGDPIYLGAIVGLRQDGTLGPAQAGDTPLGRVVEVRANGNMVVSIHGFTRRTNEATLRPWRSPPTLDEIGHDLLSAIDVARTFTDGPPPSD